MRKRILFTATVLLAMGCLHADYAQCRKAKKYQTPHGANEFILLKEIKLRRLFGSVLLPNEDPAKDAVVEVYKYREGIEKSFYGASDEKRMEACLTGTDGRFSLSRLKPGKYFLRAGTHDYAGMNAIHVVLILDPKDRQSSTAGLELVLKPGT